MAAEARTSLTECGPPQSYLEVIPTARVRHRSRRVTANARVAAPAARHGSRSLCGVVAARLARRAQTKRRATPPGAGVPRRARPAARRRPTARPAGHARRPPPAARPRRHLAPLRTPRAGAPAYRPLRKSFSLPGHFANGNAACVNYRRSRAAAGWRLYTFQIVSVAPLLIAHRPREPHANPTIDGDRNPQGPGRMPPPPSLSPRSRSATHATPRMRHMCAGPQTRMLGQHKKRALGKRLAKQHARAQLTRRAKYHRPTTPPQAVAAEGGLHHQ